MLAIIDLFMSEMARRLFERTERKSLCRSHSKKVKGRKRHIAVDTLALPIECQITPADVQDRDALAPISAGGKTQKPLG